MKLTFKSLCFLFVFSVCCWKLTCGSKKMFADPNLNTVQLLQKYGYPVEVHTIHTQDGYFLQYHRIPPGKHFKSATRQPPVLLQHGMLGSSVDFFLIGENSALPLLLADAGYDVWLGNVRGNTYSRAHEVLTPHENKFWDFSWYEMGMYDLPAGVDYICNYTRQGDLIFLGYSMGATEFLVMASSRPEYQEKIRAAIFFSPVAYLKNTKTLIRYFAPLADFVKALTELFASGELAQQNPLFRVFAKIVCTLNLFEKYLCRSLIFRVVGIDPDQIDTGIIETFLYHIPAGVSTKTLVHYAQLYGSGEFQQFDYGAKENERRYKSTKPPGFNVESINTPVYIYQGKNDLLATEEDLSQLLKRLPNVKNVTIIDYPLFNHYDFILAKDVKSLVYDQVIELFHDLTVER